MIFPSLEVVHPPVTTLAPAAPNATGRRHIILLGRCGLACVLWKGDRACLGELGILSSASWIIDPFRFFEGRQSKGHRAALDVFKRIKPWLPSGG